MIERREIRERKREVRANSKGRGVRAVVGRERKRDR